MMGVDVVEVEFSKKQTVSSAATSSWSELKTLMALAEQSKGSAAAMPDVATLLASMSNRRLTRDTRETLTSVGLTPDVITGGLYRALGCRINPGMEHPPGLTSITLSNEVRDSVIGFLQQLRLQLFLNLDDCPPVEITKELTEAKTAYDEKLNAAKKECEEQLKTAYELNAAEGLRAAQNCVRAAA